MIRVQKPYPIYNKNGWKTITFGAAHTYITRVREYPPGSKYSRLTNDAFGAAYIDAKAVYVIFAGFDFL